jgi:hypothetical protein
VGGGSVQDARVGCWRLAKRTIAGGPVQVKFNREGAKVAKHKREGILLYQTLLRIFLRALRALAVTFVER